MKRSSHLLCLGLSMGFALAASTIGLAQVPAAETLQQQSGLRPSAAGANSVTSGTNADLGDIDVVQRFPKPDTFTFSTSQQFFYTDNVFYTAHNQQGSTAYFGSYTASYVPYSLRDWTPRITLQYNMVRYGSVAAGDFDNENASFSSQYVFSSDRTWSWTANINLSRFTAPHANDHEFYKEVLYDNQVSHFQQLIKDTPLFFVTAYDVEYHQTAPGDFDRLDNTLIFSLTYNPIPQISLGPVVRPSERIYFTDTAQQNDRNDFNITESFDVTWTPCKYMSLSADVTRSDDYSNNSGLSYDNTIPGVSVTGTLKF